MVGIGLSFWTGLYTLCTALAAVLASSAVDEETVAVISLLDEYPCLIILWGSLGLRTVVTEVPAGLKNTSLERLFSSLLYRSVSEGKFGCCTSFATVNSGALWVQLVLVGLLCLHASLAHMMLSWLLYGSCCMLPYAGLLGAGCIFFGINDVGDAFRVVLIRAAVFFLFWLLRILLLMAAYAWLVSVGGLAGCYEGSWWLVVLKLNLLLDLVKGIAGDVIFSSCSFLVSPETPLPVGCE
ncbi:hypothetical protein Nepgr_014680 [Nepenthes gracilis]|uniref:Transmembrane protein n=1 Tax=Nepenthes gracilis TaxID=150966 RepID=A0AAD3XQC9_NEPGR|nr:hypothetical protein Nepgr_014680 [Nepenthes gracilis]